MKSETVQTYWDKPGALLYPEIIAYIPVSSRYSAVGNACKFVTRRRSLSADAQLFLCEDRKHWWFRSRPRHLSGAIDIPRLRCQAWEVLWLSGRHSRRFSPLSLSPLSLYGGLLCPWRQSPLNPDTPGYILSPAVRS